MEETKKEMTNEQWMQYLEKDFLTNCIPMEPTCGCKWGIRIDFNRGFRISIPKSLENRKFRLQIIDLDHDIKVKDDILNPGDYFVSGRRYFVRYGIRVIDVGSGEKFQHNYNAKGMPVIIDIPVPTVGDNIAWFSYCEAFQKKHECELYVVVPEHIRPLFEKEYPNIHFIKRSEKMNVYPYASYILGIFHEDEEFRYAPVDYRQCALHYYSAHILGLDPVANENPPRVAYDHEERTIKEPYVAIATQASGMCKMWVNPLGWDGVVKFLKESGYRVIDIDGAECQGNGIFWNHIPRDAEDFTGQNPLTQRAELIANADFFIGLGSGLSWLAWAVKKPVVLISGFSLASSEFYTPYRVINMNVCHGCYSDPRHRFFNTEYDWCPKHKGTPRHYECSRGISPCEVIAKIKTIPEFQRHIAIIKKES